MSTILLTGASGFLGSHLLKYLIDDGYNVVILKRSTSDTSRINHLLEYVDSYNIDQIELSSIFDSVKIDVIINTVCSYGRGSESLAIMIKSNLIFGLELLEAAVKNNVGTFINTDSLLPRTLNNYSLSKAQLTDWLQKFSDQIQVVNFKIEHMYGPNDDSKKFLPWLVDEMLEKTCDINLTSGIQKRDFVHIYDVIEAYAQVLRKLKNLGRYSQFDVGTGNFIAMKEIILQIADKIQNYSNSDIRSRLMFGSVAYRAQDIMKPALNLEGILALGWSPKIDTKEGIDAYVDNLIIKKLGKLKN